MKKIVSGLLCALSLTQAIEIDISFVKEQVVRNKDDIDNRILLTKYYLQHGDYKQARHYSDEVLALSPKHAHANKIAKKLTLLESLQKDSGRHDTNMQKSLDSLYQNKSYAKFVSYYEQLQALGFVMSKSVDIEATVAYDALGMDEKARALVAKYPEVRDAKFVKIKEALSPKVLKVARKPLKPSMEDYVYSLKQKHSEKVVIEKLESFVKAHPKDTKARIALAQNIYWSGNVKGAFHALYSVRKHNLVSQTLYANILYDMGDYKNALYFLPEVSEKAKSHKERYYLKKRLAFAYLHVGEKAKAEALMHTLEVQNTEDTDIRHYREDIAKNALLAEAIQYHKQKNYAQALHAYKGYHDKTKEPKIAKEIAEIYYFNQKEKLSLPYFEQYLKAYPQDTLMRFHYASALEKNKNYKKSVVEFKEILRGGKAKEHNLAMYHYANSLMHTYQDADWLQARGTLAALITKLEQSQNPKDKDLLKFSKSLYTTSQGPIRKPTRYKDIILTEGSYKLVNPREVFAMEDIRFVKNPSSKALLHTAQSMQNKPQFWLELEYADDRDITFYNNKIGVDHLLGTQGVNYGLYVEQFDFTSKSKREDGTGIFLKAQMQKWSVGLGLEHFDDFDTIVPEVTWKPSVEAHNFFVQAYYRNGAFINYRGCMIENQTSVYHLGVYDNILMDDLDFTEIGLDINAFEDENINFYGQFTYPLLRATWIGLEHRFVLNENVEYNTKTDVCSKPLELYDTTYIKYQPKYHFYDGELSASAGVGYAFNNEDVVYSYGIKADYTIEGFATLYLNCERLQSSFTTEDMNFCKLNLMQDW